MKYLIDTPPPTISGSKKNSGLHIGHIFSYTQGDIIARYQKYLNKELIYPKCFDTNGIPTQKSFSAISNEIPTSENIIKFAIERSKFYEETFKLADINFGTQSYHTYDSQSIEIAYMAFNKLKELGIAYKANTEFLWSEKLKTSISQSELDDNGLIERTGEIPIIKKTEGWFINIKDHLSEIKKMSDKIKWMPFEHKKRIDDWIQDIKWDWSISRERNFGIPIPGEENMTFDTWFISSLTPQLAWSAEIGKSSLECPIFDMRYQSHDIIRTWAFYTIAMSYFLNNQIPWKSIMITGHTLDGKGDKFSKSSGNATNPIPLIEKYGSSGIRHWSTSNSLGLDTKIDENKMKMGWKMKNKFLNARKFLEMQISNNWIGRDDIIYQEWIEFKTKILDAFNDMNLSLANEIIYKFFWNNFCDIWIENSKMDSISLTLIDILNEFEPIFNIIYGD